MKHLNSITASGLVLAAMLLPTAGLHAQSPDLPDGPGKDIVEQNCAVCHGLELITAKRRTPAAWSDVLNRMLASGAQLDEEQSGVVLAYLKSNLGAQAGAAQDAPAMASSKARPASRPSASKN